MPLSKLQVAILRTIAASRSPESFVAGSTPLHRDGPRFSGDIDIFHDREERVELVAAQDAALLVAAGYGLTWQRRQPGLHTALVAGTDDATRLEWVRDSDYRFFPAQKDDLFGYILHISDIATNKALASAGRQAPRDALDLLFIHQNHLPLGAVIWAAVAKDPGFSPESLLAEIRRNTRYTAEDYETLTMRDPIDAALVAQQLRAALTEAEAFMETMPEGKEGLLFLRDGKPAQPDPLRLDLFQTVEGRRQTIWPGSSEISSAMLDKYSGLTTPNRT